MQLVLGSTSPFRRQLLEKLGLPFSTDSPAINESARPDETPSQLVQRLAMEKAREVGKRHEDALIIGSDQVACIDDIVLGKPGDRAGAIRQLTAASGRSVEFLTGLCLFNTRTGASQTAVEPFRVHFRRLDQQQIARYVDREKPFNCAGSFKSEGFGITLFESLEGSDPNALVGLPLIRLVAMLGIEGVAVP
jgi:MAF protein